MVCRVCKRFSGVGSVKSQGESMVQVPLHGVLRFWLCAGPPYSGHVPALQFGGSIFGQDMFCGLQRGPGRGTLCVLPTAGPGQVG